eukprot:m.157077 g.157077  ORF g.157077 m.157077 type:complete len:263 (+) comp38700_c0_seq4:185-973(+)
MKSSLLLFLLFLIPFEEVAFSAIIHSSVRIGARRNTGSLQIVEEPAETVGRHLPTGNAALPTVSVTLPEILDPTRSGGGGKKTKDNCHLCGQQLNSLTQFCSEEREIYGFPLTIFNHTQLGRYEVNILKDGFGDELIGQVIFPQYFKERVAKCRCWNISVTDERKWPVRLAIGFPPDGKKNLATSVSRLMKKADALVCPMDKYEKRARFYLVEAKLFLQKNPGNNGVKGMKPVISSREEKTTKLGLAKEKIKDESQEISVLS